MTPANGSGDIFFYGQDTWRVTPKLTLTYGLRWEIYRPQRVTGKDRGGWFNLANGEIDVAGENGVPLSGPVVTNLKNFAPRAGLAYQVNPKTVVRVGYGRSFDVGMFGTIFGHTVTQNLPVLGTQQINPLPNGWDPAFQLATGPPLLDPANSVNQKGARRELHLSRRIPRLGHALPYAHANRGLLERHGTAPDYANVVAAGGLRGQQGIAHLRR